MHKLLEDEMTVIGELQAAGGDVVRTLTPGIVRIGRGPGRGAGFVIAEDAVLTNAHNIRGPETTVTFADGEAVVASLAGVDPDHDLAVLRVDGVNRPVPSWRGAAPDLGTPVFVVTAPADAAVRLSFGMVSAVDRVFRGPRGRLIRGGVEHTAPLARGSSGSPVTDVAGHVVGINTHRLGEGFYLALPADDDLRARVDALARGESPSRRYLGVSLYPTRAARRLRASVGLPEREGLLVRSVDPEGPAARSGVREGDLIVGAAGTAFADPDDLFEALAHARDGSAFGLQILRGSDEIELDIDFEAPETEGSP